MTRGEHGAALDAEAAISSWARSRRTADAVDVLRSWLEPTPWVLLVREAGSHRAFACGSEGEAPLFPDVALDAALARGEPGVDAHGWRLLPLPVEAEPRWVLAVPDDALEPSALAPALTHLAAALDRSSRFEALERLSTIDPVTGLFNARHLQSALEREVSRCERFGGSLCLLFLDLDHFKAVNDSLGHPAGTALLADIGRLLLESIRQTDYAFRYGGDEFAILLVEATKVSGTRVADRVRRSIESRSQRWSDARGRITASIGVATFPTDAGSVQSLIARADAAMYAAKDRGRNAVYTINLGGRERRPSSAGHGLEDTMTLTPVNQPVLLWDVMGTLVTEPFIDAVPRHFQTSLELLLQEKDPQAWIRFERGEIDEDQYCAEFFRDRRPVDKHALKSAMRDAYDFMPDIEEILSSLHANGVAMYALSNYSPWYQIIEDKLRISRFVGWDFVSCHTGFRKPEPEAYATVVEKLGVTADQCVFVDDRTKNVDAARRMGMKAILRPDDPDALRAELVRCGIPVQLP